MRIDLPINDRNSNRNNIVYINCNREKNRQRTKFYVSLVVVFQLFRLVCGAIAPGAEAICNRVPGLTAKQREMCRASPDAMVAVGDGVRLASDECRHQFRHHRWNCTDISNPNSFGHVVTIGSREAAFTYAISSAGVTYAIAAACTRGNITACGCAPGPLPHEPSPYGWKWGGCSADVGYGTRYGRRFMDARELEGDARTLMNLHNNKAGRKSVKANLLTECKCHGVSGSCTMKTCWKTLPPFRQIGDNLMKKYYRARRVTAVTTAVSSDREESDGGDDSMVAPSFKRTVDGKLERRSTFSSSPPTQLSRRFEETKRKKKRRGDFGDENGVIFKKYLVLKKGNVAVKRTPKKTELVFLQMSPNYCERDLEAGSLGTIGRTCNRTSRGTDGCDLMCCGRGYNTHQYTRTWQCRCKFHWCCYVECDTCNERTEEYTCK